MAMGVRTGVARNTIFAALLAFGAAAALGCGRTEEGGPGGKVKVDENRLELQGTVAVEDEDVVNAMKTPKAPGLIIYDAPTDLSLGNAQQRRPDLFPKAAPKDTARSAAAKDTNTAEATTVERRRRPNAPPQEKTPPGGASDSTKR